MTTPSIVHVDGEKRMFFGSQTRWTVVNATSGVPGNVSIGSDAGPHGMTVDGLSAVRFDATSISLNMEVGNKPWVAVLLEGDRS
jgi:hypothetical protein